MFFIQMGIDVCVVVNLLFMGIDVLLFIQEKVIFGIVVGCDLLGLVQIGIGKIVVFGLLMLICFLNIGCKFEFWICCVLIFVFICELVIQIVENIDFYVVGIVIWQFCVVGGVLINVQIMWMECGVDVLIVMFGWLIDLIECGVVDLLQIKYLVLDEVDQMLDIGFIYVLCCIVKLLLCECQMLLFLVIMFKLMEELVDSYLIDLLKVVVNLLGQVVVKIEQGVYFVNQGDKVMFLVEYLGKYCDELVIVFGCIKYGCEKLLKLFEKWGFKVVVIYGNKLQGQWEWVLLGFCVGEIKVLVVIDVVVCGIDILDVVYVYNYDLLNVFD